MAEENTDNQYVVLARKYRPQTFEDLLGQDALVQTLTNAIKNNRLHHAYILTGIRGVGKTTTARLIARALNCTGLDGKGGPTIHPCGVCENCRAIAAGRHIDVMELDAASRTGVDDMRELLDGVRYKPTNARYKVYITDEVHMLSKGAFNALLKTLEEPPAHVKFIFATTEIRKVPVTILSRCQRFDLQRLNVATLMQLFHKVITAENLNADEEALEMIARAADGSARDGLSMLDQAIVLGDGKIKAETVIEMIGLADRNQTLNLFEHLIAGDIPSVLKNLQIQYQNGANPLAILQDLIDVTHMLTKAKIVPSALNTEMLSESNRELCSKLASTLSVAVLSRMWQMMLKGLTELNSAQSPLDALEMILIRIAYSASLPTPAEILEEVKKKSDLISGRPNISVAIPQSTVNTQVTQPEIKPVRQEKSDTSTSVPLPATPSACPMNNLLQLVTYMEEHKKALLLYSLKNDVSVEKFGNWQMEITLSEKTPPDFIAEMRKILTAATGGEWQIIQHHGQLNETLAEKENTLKEADKKSASEHPLVKAVLNNFKGAKFDTITRKVLETEAEDSADEEESNKENSTPTYEEEE